MNISTDGLILRVQNIGESDRVATVLTREYGLLRAFMRGARGMKSRLHSAASQFCYARLTLFKGRDKYIIDDAEPIDTFFALRGDVEKLALAQYLAEIAMELSPEEDRAEPFLRLMLNSLHLLAKSRYSALHIKAVAELRMTALAGYMPDLIACAGCGEFTSDTMYFDVQSGSIFCGSCPRPGGLLAMGSGVTAAMRHIVFSKPEKIFSFNLPTGSEHALSGITEKFLLAQSCRGYKTLDFFYSITEATDEQAL